MGWMASIGRWAVLLGAFFCFLQPAAVWADEVWEFVDRDGVVHMGNGAPPPSRGVTWLSRVPLAKATQGGKERDPSALLNASLSKDALARCNAMFTRLAPTA